MSHCVLGVLPFAIFSSVFGKGSKQHSFESSLFLALVLTARLLVMSLSALLVTATTEREAMAGALLYCIRPLRFVGMDVERTAAVLALGFEYAPEFIRTAHLLVQTRFAKRRLSIRNAPNELGDFLGELVVSSMKAAKGARSPFSK
jgi:energy-coupling factor transporter transmembrane protein EcfT